MEQSTATEIIDAALPDALVLSIVLRHVPGAQRVTFVDESGRKGRAYFIDDEIVLKTQRPARLRGRVIEEFETSLEKEFFFLHQIEAGGGIPAPTPLGYGREGAVEYACMTRVRGQNLRQAELSPEQRPEALTDVG